jgi:hypothetical protein
VFALTVPTATIVPAPEHEQHSRQDREALEATARAARTREARVQEPGTAPPLVLLAGEDEDACRKEPHIWRGID